MIRDPKGKEVSVKMISAIDSYAGGPYKDRVSNEKNYSYVKNIQGQGKKMSTIMWEMGLRSYSQSVTNLETVHEK